MGGGGERVNDTVAKALVRVMSLTPSEMAAKIDMAVSSS